MNYALGLADAVLGNGGLIFENTTVSSIEGGGSPALKLQSGKTVACSQIVVACNAYLGSLVPGLNHRVMPVASYVVATEPLGEERARGLIRDNEAVCDSNYVVDYFRMTADHRLLFGGRCSYSGIHPRDLGANMRPRVLRIFPQLDDVQRCNTPGAGTSALPTTDCQIWAAVTDPSIMHTGFPARALCLPACWGRCLPTPLSATRSTFDVFARIRHLPFPGGILRRPGLTLGMLYYRIRDLLS